MNTFFDARLIRALFLLFIPVCSLLPSVVLSEESVVLDSMEGQVEVLPAGENDFKAAVPGQQLNLGDVVRTMRRSKASVIFADGVLMRLAENSLLEIKSVRKGDIPRVSLDLKEGKSYFFSKDPKNIPEINTPTVSTAIRGTEFVVEASLGETTVSVIDGTVECSNAWGSVIASNGEAVLAKQGVTPLKSIVLNPLDAVQWALYYPAVVDLLDFEDDFKAGSKEEQEGFEALKRADFAAANTNFKGNSRLKLLGNALYLIQIGETKKALEFIEAHGDNFESLLVLKAGLNLSFGEVDQAEAALERAKDQLKTGGQESLLALLHSQNAIIALVKNNKDRASESLAEARKQDPSSRAELLASSYVSQAYFDLEGARESLKTLVKLSPKNAFAYARLAEVELSFAELEKAKELLSSALEISPKNAYALSVLGYYHLIRYETKAAKEAFLQAIASDGALGMARLGLGLAMIRKGDLENGRREIEKAAFLEPGVAVYRSYLGKAFFEEEREGPAAHEYERAISLDPNDPTPYLYRAFNDLSQNEPVKALSDVETSINLNENRAVYRSSLQLDQDLAVRGAGLSEVFNALGFSQASRVEAIKSINRDYSNFSAHRLLADSYSTIQLNDAGLSEQRIAVLLSPLSFNLLRSSGSEASLNDYSALFDKEEHRTETSFEGSTYDDLLFPGISRSGKTDKFGYLMSYDFLSTGGSKERNYFMRHRGRGSLQYQPNYENRFFVDGTALFLDNVDDQLAVEESELDDYNVNIGYRGKFSANSVILGELALSNQRHKFIDNLTNRFIDLVEISGDEGFIQEDELLINEQDIERIDSLRASAQYIFDSKYFSTVLGSQIYFADTERLETSGVIDDALGVFPDISFALKTQGLNNLNSYDFYLYNTLHLTEYLDVNVGLNFTEIELEEREISPFVGETFTRSKVSPKFGVSLYPTSSTTVRAAYFETVRKSSLEDTLALEPTIVGGLNQIFTDLSGARARNAGVGIDQKFPGNTYLGIEAIHRDVIEDIRPGVSSAILDFDELNVSQDVFLSDVFEDHQDQDFLKGYIYQVFSKRWVGSLDCEYFSLERTDTDFYQEQQLNKVQGSMRYFHPTGFFGILTSTWREQDTEGMGFGLDGVSDFWVFDVGLGYRIPKRHGSILLQFANIFDEEFTYDQSLGFEEFLHPGFGARLLATFNF